MKNNEIDFNMIEGLLSVVENLYPHSNWFIETLRKLLEMNEDDRYDFFELRSNVPDRYNIQGYYKGLRKDESNGLSNLSISMIKGPLKKKGSEKQKKILDFSSPEYGDPARAEFGSRENVNLHNNHFQNRDDVEVHARRPDNFQFNKQNDPRDSLTNFAKKQHFPEGNIAPLEPDYDDDSNYNQRGTNSESYNQLKQTVRSNFKDFVRDSQASRTSMNNFSSPSQQMNRDYDGEDKYREFVKRNQLEDSRYHQENDYKQSNIRSSSKINSSRNYYNKPGNFFQNSNNHPTKPIALNSYNHDNRPVYNPPVDSKQRLNHRKIGHEDDVKMIDGLPYKKTEIEKYETDPRTGGNVKKTYLSWVPI